MITQQNGRIVNTVQKATKSGVLFLEKLDDEHIILTSEANEVIKLNLKNKEKRQHKQTITQVKQDYYNSVFKSDSCWLGFSCMGKCCCGMSEENIFVWSADIQGKGSLPDEDQ